MRNRFICRLVRSPSKPQIDGSIAKSMSSEKRRITFPRPAKQVPATSPRSQNLHEDPVGDGLCEPVVIHPPAFEPREDDF